MSTVPNIQFREYNPETGALLNNVSSLSFGRVTKGTHSRVKVVDIAFDNATAVGNLRVGLIADAGVTVNSDPQGFESDGTASNGHFGIEYSESFDATKASTSLSRHFAGINQTITADDEFNVSIGYPSGGMRSANVSYYIYLDIEVGSSNTSSGNGAYKIFFDFS
ncbi:MAG: hypothetical protein RLY43_2326 [Bacteroidota bacterium]|jgi:hypothetical protein